MVVFSLYSMVDGFFVAKYVGENALSAVNISMPFINLVFALGIIAAVGSQTLCGVFIGKKDYLKANKIFSFNIMAVSILSLILTFLFYIFREKIAVFLGATGELFPYVMDYFGNIIYFVPFFMISYNMEILVKVDGFPRLAMKTVLTCGISNVALDYLLVGVLGWGIKGAAIATGISQLISTIVYLIHFTVGKSNLEFVEVKFSFETLKNIFVLGIGDFVSEVGVGVIIFLYNLFIIKFLGTDEIATFTVISYLNQLVLMVFSGITQGIQPLLSYYYGQKDFKSCKKIFKKALVTVMATAIIFFLIFHLYSSNIFGLFLGEHPEHISYSVTAMMKFTYSFFIAGFNVLIAAVCVSFIMPKYSILINVFRSILFIALALFVTTKINPEYIWFSSLISEALTFVFAIIFYLSLKARNRRIAKKLQKQKQPGQI